MSVQSINTVNRRSNVLQRAIPSDLTGDLSIEHRCRTSLESSSTRCRLMGALALKASD